MHPKNVIDVITNYTTLSEIKNDVKEKRTSAYIAAQNLLDTYFNILKK